LQRDNIGESCLALHLETLDPCAASLSKSSVFERPLSATTWQPELEESVSVDDFTAKSTKPESFVVNVRSGAKGHDSAGRAWSDY